MQLKVTLSADEAFSMAESARAGVAPQALEVIMQVIRARAASGHTFAEVGAIEFGLEEMLSHAGYNVQPPNEMTKSWTILWNLKARHAGA